MWTVITTDLFDTWFRELDDVDRNNTAAYLLLLQDKGPQLSRPYADTLEGSKIKNLKELRIQSKGRPIRAFFAFDPRRQAIILCAGDKTGDKRFYKKMIPIAETEFDQYMKKLTD